MTEISISIHAKWAADDEPHMMQSASVVAVVHHPTNRRQDPANASPTVKALIDGCVDAGLLPDDDAEHLTRVSFERGEPTGRKGWYAVTLRFEEVE